MTTEAAQRRLIEALADIQRQGLLLEPEHPDPLGHMADDIRAMANLPLVAEFPHVIRYYLALGDLFEAVRADQTTTERSH